MKLEETRVEGVRIETHVTKTKLGLNIDRYDITIYDRNNSKIIGYFCVKYSEGENTAHITEITAVSGYNWLTANNRERYNPTWNFDNLIDKSRVLRYKGMGSILMQQIISWIYNNLKQVEYIGIHCTPGREDRVLGLLEKTQDNTNGIIKDIRGGGNERAWDIRLFKN